MDKGVKTEQLDTLDAGVPTETVADSMNPAPVKKDETPELLFDFMRELIYGSNPSLEVEQLNDAYQDVGKGLLFFAQLITEAKEFASALAKGEVNTVPPGRENELASPLKALQGSLRHISWQSQQVAKGDYKQRVDFMGDFAEAFNSMVMQLDFRQRALEQEIEAGREKTRALEVVNSLVTNITENIPQALIVFDEIGDNILYKNKAATIEILRTPLVIDKLKSFARNNVCLLSKSQDVELECGGERRYYTMQPYDLQWEGQSARAFLVEDTSDRRARVQELERRANWDALTHLYNRYFGMLTLQTWLDEGRAFTVFFADLDHLKFINDTFGHAEGDKYIVRAAQLIEEFMPTAVACRVGGDEFMVLCPCLKEEGEKRMEAMTEAFRETGEAVDKPYLSNLSYGMLEVQENSPLLSGDILSEADARMYKQKRKNKQARGSLPPLREVKMNSD